MSKGWNLVDKTRLFLEVDGFNWHIGELDGVCFYSATGSKHDDAARKLIVATLNRELPGGKPRKRKAKLSQEEKSLAEYVGHRHGKGGLAG
jgi:hypothetical protein